MLALKRWGPRAQASLEGTEAPRDERGSVLLIGFGRFGQVASQHVLAQGLEITIIDNDPQVTRDATEFGFKVFYGDGTRADVLHAAGRPGWVHVNLIPLNPTPGSKWTASREKDERTFVRRLQARGIAVTVRDTRGREIDGACGQLAATDLERIAEQAAAEQAAAEQAAAEQGERS